MRFLDSFVSISVGYVCLRTNLNLNLEILLKAILKIVVTQYQRNWIKKLF